ncbi:thiolase family protein [Bacillus taeanensis]|uniref:acetyl-CoA C-acetyltransferase n=1 Tax=Bacillus taeanensis TaxID=273032 RepID=A0A366XW55_9BACI|nr:thiolase family protein [Bacillus taeanensis]RBW70382.1 acetyl-CoA C-acyltransferase [Bacillus taeanensis]
MIEIEVYILDGARTAFAEFGGVFSSLSAIDLGKITAVEAIKRSGAEPDEIDQVVYGNVIQSSIDSPYLARHILLKAGIPMKTPALTVNRLCGSGMQSVISAVQSIKLKESRIALVGGTENMSQVPHADFTSRFGSKLGNIKLEDMLLHTLTDRYIGYGMGITAENLSEHYQISRESQDEYAALSHTRASKARKNLAEEMIEIEIQTKKGPSKINEDQHVKEETTVEKLKHLKPAFKKSGTVTAGNASGINDGAVSLVIADKEYAKKRHPLAKIVSYGICGIDPTVMGIGPVLASQIALQRANLSMNNIDLIEINEAFAAQYLAVEKELQLDRSKTNVNGGAIALGHPVGASGARIILTLAYELRRQNKRFGLASLCIGGGQGIAMIIENVS